MDAGSADEGWLFCRQLFRLGDPAFHAAGESNLLADLVGGDFLLQLECISHGPHLNSGVFFRCREGEYQNGYEAQIRNQFTPEPTQEYTLEDYDPVTHKRLADAGQEFFPDDMGTPQALAKYQKQEIDKWWPIIKAAGVKAQQ